MQQNAAGGVNAEPRVEFGVRQRAQDELANRPQGFLDAAEVRERDVPRRDGLECVHAVAAPRAEGIPRAVADAAGLVLAPSGEVVLQKVVAKLRLVPPVLLVVHPPVVPPIAPVAALRLLQAPGAGERDGRDVSGRRRVRALLPPARRRGGVSAGAAGRSSAASLTLRRERALRRGGDDVWRRERGLFLASVRVVRLGRGCGRVEPLKISVHLERGIVHVRPGLVRVHLVALPVAVVVGVVGVVVGVVGAGVGVVGAGAGAASPVLALGEVRRLHRLERVAAGVGPRAPPPHLLARALHHLAEDVRGLAQVLAVDAPEVLHGRGDVGRVAPVLREFLDSRDEGGVAAGGVAAAAPGAGAGRPAVLPRGLTLELAHRCRGPRAPGDAG